MVAEKDDGKRFTATFRAGVILRTRRELRCLEHRAIHCFAIGARVTLLWQHNANASYKLASIPRYDDILRTAGWAWSARAAGRRPAGDGGRPPNPRAAYGKRARQARRRPAADGGRSQHYCGSLECGLPLVAFWQQKGERKMLASTCLYSLYAWLYFVLDVDK